MAYGPASFTETRPKNDHTNAAANIAATLKGEEPKAAFEAELVCIMDSLDRGMLVFRRVIFPIAMRQALPAYGNEIVLMVKASALASTVTLVEITGIADRINSRHFAPFEVFTTAGAIYLMINYLATEIVRLAEWRLTPYLRPPHELGHRLTPLDLVRQRPTLVILSVVFIAGLVWGELQ